MSISLSKFIGNNVIFNQQGIRIGKLMDIIFSKETGKIVSYVIKLKNFDNIISKLPKIEKDLIMVPFPFITFMDDKFVVFENEVSEFLEEKFGTRRRDLLENEELEE